MIKRIVEDWNALHNGYNRTELAIFRVKVYSVITIITTWVVYFSIMKNI